MEFIDLKTQYRNNEQSINRRIKTVLEHGQYILGPEVAEFEKALSNFTGAKHSIGVANGTDALLICLRALDVQAGDEVIVPAFSFFATAEVVSQLGALPVFVDVDTKTYNMSANALERAITAKTKAIIAVGLYGLPADFDAINTVAAKRAIPVIEDAAQSFGGSMHGKRSCNLTTIAATSFFPAKPLGCYGDGGACFTNNDKLADKIRLLRFHGQQGRYNHVEVGYNSRLDTLQAAILIEKLAIFPAELEMRDRIALRYHEKLKGKVATPHVPKGFGSSWAQYTIEVENREAFAAKMKDAGIPTSVHYPKSLHQQPVYEKKYGHLSIPVSESAAAKVISLPMHPYLSEADQDLIVAAVLKSLK
jgi:UDP-2-acetamido-2-deoxy-ribo-hexuluronate aminotransferase